VAGEFCDLFQDIQNLMDEFHSVFMSYQAAIYPSSKFAPIGGITNGIQAVLVKEPAT
jgi:hypothetical protein